MLNERQFCVAVASALALMAFVFTMRFIPDFVTWGGWTVCGPEDCNLQSWLGALSGWFGGLTAVATIGFVMLQLREQRLQTAFSVGDAYPTMDAIEHLNDWSELVVRIVNWNRRGIVVRFLDVEAEDALIFPNRILIDGQEKKIEKIEFGVAPFAIKGWEDRSRAPHHAEIRVVAYREVGDELGFQKNWRDIPKISATVQILGDSHKVIILKADTRPLLH